jgi:Flp pilus assembly protein TadB
MSEKRGPFPFRSLLGTLTVILVISAIDRLTHSDVLWAFATIVILGAYVAWWFWSRRYS